MRSSCVFYIIITLTTTSLQNTSDLNSVNYIFNNVSKDVEDTVIRIFKVFQVPPNSVRLWRKKEIEMYKYLKNTVQINYHIFQNLTTQIIDDDKNNISIDDILNDIFIGNVNCTNAEATIVQVFNYFIPLVTRKADPEDPYDISLEFVKEFMDKVDNWSIDDFINPERNFTSNIRRLQNNTVIEDNVTHDLEVWNPEQNSHEDNGTNTRRLYLGKMVDISNFSFMASVHEDGEFVCAGCIIRSELIISAASCLQRVYESSGKPHFISVRVGSNHVNTGGFMVACTHAIFHPLYDINTLQNNLVLLNVAVGAFTRLQWIKRIRYQNTQTEYDSLKIIGWGTENSDGENTVNSILQIIMKTINAENTSGEVKDELPLTYDKLNVYSSKECADIYSRFYITENNTCAGYLLSGNGACQYDIGGPGIYNGNLIGIVSFGSVRCGAKDKPTVFTNVAPYLKWIHNVLHEVIPKIKPRQANETFIKSRFNRSNDRQGYNRRLLNLVKTLEIAETKEAKKGSASKQDFYDVLSQYVPKNNSLVPLLCLFDESCELDINSDEEFKENSPQTKERKQYSSTSDTNIIRKENTTYGPPLIQAVPKSSKEITMTGKKSSHPFANNASSIEDMKETTDVKKRNKHKHLDSSVISDIATAVFLENKGRKHSMRKTKSSKRQRKHRVRNKKRRKRKRHHKTKYKIKIY